MLIKMSSCSLSSHKKGNSKSSGKVSVCNLKSNGNGAKGLMGDLGPGIWFCFHTMSLQAINSITIDSLIYFIKTTVDHFKCDVCRGHAIQYLNKNPPELNANHLFEWTIDFHNDVNIRNDKPTWSYAKAYKYYKH